MGLSNRFLWPYYICNISKKSNLACVCSSPFLCFPGYFLLGQPNSISTVCARSSNASVRNINLACRKLYYETLSFIFRKLLPCRITTDQHKTSYYKWIV